MNTVAQKLTEARDYLTPETWAKKAFFHISPDNQICMCAHAAVQLAINQSLKKFVSHLQNPGVLDPGSANNSNLNLRTINICHTFSLSEAHEGAMLIEAFGSIQKAWENRPKRGIWCSGDYPDNEEYIHCFLGMIGLTSSFNDDPETTYDMVIEKFNQAISVAEELGI